MWRKIKITLKGLTLYYSPPAQSENHRLDVSEMIYISIKRSNYLLWRPVIKGFTRKLNNVVSVTGCLFIFLLDLYLSPNLSI